MHIADLTGTPAGSFATHLLSLLGYDVRRPSEQEEPEERLLYHRAKLRTTEVEPDGCCAVVVDEESTNRFGDVVSRFVEQTASDRLVARLLEVDGVLRAPGFVLDHGLGTSNELPAGDPYREYAGVPLALPGRVTEHDIGGQFAAAIVAWLGHSGTIEMSGAQATLVTHRYSIDMPEVEPEAAAVRTLNYVFAFAGVLRCADGWVEMAIITDAAWRTLAHWLGDPEWSKHASFPSKEALDVCPDAIQQDIRDWTAQKLVDELIAMAERDGLPVAEYKRIETALAEPEAQARGYSDRIDDLFVPRLAYCPAPLIPPGTPPERLGEDPLRPLAGLVVTDFTIAQAGAQAAWVLAQLGATVVKVEHPDKPDIARTWSPRSFDASFAFVEPNGGKLGISVRWDEPDGCRLLEALVAKSHLFISNVRPDTLLKTGFTFERVRSINPGIAYVTISAEGTDDQHRRRPGWAPTFGAASGLGEAVSADGLPPVEMSQWADYAVGNMAALGALQALRVTRSTGAALEVDVCAAAALALLASDTALERQRPTAARNATGVSMVQDGLVAFASGPAVTLSAVGDLSRLAAVDAVQRLRDAGFSAARVCGVDDVYAGVNGFGMDPFWVLDKHELLDRPRRTVRPAWRFNEHQVGSTQEAPWLGQHTDFVATELLQIDAAVSSSTAG